MSAKKSRVYRCFAHRRRHILTIKQEFAGRTHILGHGPKMCVRPVWTDLCQHSISQRLTACITRRAPCTTCSSIRGLAPHTGRPYSEALLLGISGGIATGYFLFDYKGHDPHCILLTRNTFDPWDTVLTRLGIPVHMLQTTDAGRADRALLDALEGGKPAVVWADIVSLPCYGHAPSTAWWAMTPHIVFGHDNGQVQLATSARVPLTVSADELSAARGRVKKHKFRLITLDAPDPRKLRDAVSKGLWQCMALFTDKPPKGAAKNFGFAALQHWAAMLTNTRNPQSWARFFPPGPKRFSALAGGGMQPGLYGCIMQGGFGDGAERGAYADFLDEAATLLDKPGLRAAVADFRASQGEWRALASALLPADATALAEARALKDRRQVAFRTQPADAIQIMRDCDERISALRTACGQAWPQSEAAITAWQADIAMRVLAIHDIEFGAVRKMQVTLT